MTKPKVSDLSYVGGTFYEAYCIYGEDPERPDEEVCGWHFPDGSFHRYGDPKVVRSKAKDHALYHRNHRVHVNKTDRMMYWLPEEQNNEATEG
jgi:hypothetical protein